MSRKIFRKVPAGSPSLSFWVRIITALTRPVWLTHNALGIAFCVWGGAAPPRTERTALAAWSVVARGRFRPAA
jgi:hypothetical protein